MDDESIPELQESDDEYMEDFFTPDPQASAFATSCASYASCLCDF